jgi:hypothetical protein
MITLLRGAIPSPRHRLAAATPHKLSGTTPASLLYQPSRLSMWLNNIDGDCVTAEEAFAKACWVPEIFISDAEVQTWAVAHGVLNGAVLYDVLEWMNSGGFQQSGHIYDDGPAVSVDWTNAIMLQNAIYHGPVKIGVAADQLQKAVQDAGPDAGPDQDQPENGWMATGFVEDSNEDHCVSLCGYGTFEWLATRLLGRSPGRDWYGEVDPLTPGYGLFTWSSIGIIDHPSMLAITQEAWLRNPTTVIRTP